MIEFELKYKIASPEQILRFVRNNSVFAQQDDYFDTKDGLLYQRGNFLRLRDRKRVDFKLFAGDETHLFCEETSFDVDQFSSDNSALVQVCCRIGFNSCPFIDFEDFRRQHSLDVIAPIRKERYQFRKERLVLSIDKIEGLGTFLEAELDFPDSSFDKREAKSLLESRLIQEGFIDLSVDEYVRVGYVELYLMQSRPELYQVGKYKQ